MDGWLKETDNEKFIGAIWLSQFDLVNYEIPLTKLSMYFTS